MFYLHFLYVTGDGRPSHTLLKRYTKSIAMQWSKLGIDLLGENEEFKIIMEKYSNDDEKCCSEMFRLWLDRDPKASWNQLIKSLSKINLETLVKQIKQELLQNPERGSYMCGCML